MADEKLRDHKDFVPYGAIAFFIALALLGAIIWYSMYFLMLSKV